jgi:micrococcal nuclease
MMCWMRCFLSFVLGSRKGVPTLERPEPEQINFLDVPMKRFYLILFLLVATASNVDAKNCKKGKPCGNSCIAMDKECRLESSSSSSGSSSYSPPDYSSGGSSSQRSIHTMHSSSSYSYSSAPPQIIYKCNGVVVTESEYKNCKLIRQGFERDKELTDTDSSDKKKITHLPKTRTIVATEILDADIFQCAGKKQQKIRLYGIDAPEKGQPFYQEAKDMLKKLLYKKKIIAKIYSDDSNGTDMAVVFANRKNINELMVESGYAWVYGELCTEPFCDNWIENEEEAQSQKKGLWSDPGRLPPWVWR